MKSKPPAEPDILVAIEALDPDQLRERLRESRRRTDALADLLRLVLQRRRRLPGGPGAGRAANA